MESIKAAFYALKNGVARSKVKASEAVLSAVDDLSGILSILKQDNTSQAVFLKLAQTLRNSIQPVYNHELDLALNFVSSVFLGLHTSRVLNSKYKDSRMDWENLQSAILSGLLDYLDENSTGKTKLPVAQTFFTTLCKLYIPTSAESSLDVNSDLLCNVFMLLSDVVCGQPTNAVALRRELAGGRRLGYLITKIRDFLPLEAALDLFINIVLVLKRGSSGQSDRMKFIKEVLSPELFDSELLNAVSKVTDIDMWQETCPIIMKTLGSSNISSPQFFDVTHFKAQGIKCNAPEGVVFESSAVICSIPVKTGMETLRVPFAEIGEVSLLSDGEDCLVSLSMSSPPILGKERMKGTQKEVSVQWKIPVQELKRFINGLQHRKVTFKADTFERSRKLSVAQAGVQLDFKLPDDEPPKPTQERIHAITQLWDRSDATRGVEEESSPTTHAIFPPNSEDAKLNEAKPFQDAAVFIDQDGNLTNAPVDMKQIDTSPIREQKQKERSNEAGTNEILMNKAVHVLLSASNSLKRTQDLDDPLQPKVSRKRKRNIVLSDQESELTDPDEYDPPSPTPVRTSSLYRSGSAGMNIEPRAPSTRQASMRNAPKPKVADVPVPKSRPKTTAERPNTVRQSTRLKENVPPVAVKPEIASPKPIVTSAKKRSTPPPPDDDEPPLPPPKKQRVSPAPASEARSTRPVTRYRAKNRSSTPATVNLVDDDDEPPRPPSKAPIISVKAEKETKPRRTAMKDKAGKAKPRPVPVNKRKAAAANRQSVARDVETKETVRAQEAEKKKQQPEPRSVVKAEPKEVKLEATTPHLRAAQAAPKPSTKPKKAIWQRDSFLDNVKAQNRSTPAAISAVKIEEQEPEEEDTLDWGGRAPEGAFDFGEKPNVAEAEERMDTTDDVQDVSDTFVNDPIVDEYVVPTKNDGLELSPIPQDEPMFVMKPGEDAIMIDLTSPQPEAKTPSHTVAPVRAKRAPTRSEAPQEAKVVQETLQRAAVKENAVAAMPKYRSVATSAKKPAEQTTVEDTVQKTEVAEPARKEVAVVQKPPARNSAPGRDVVRDVVKKEAQEPEQPPGAKRDANDETAGLEQKNTQPVTEKPPAQVQFQRPERMPVRPGEHDEGQGALKKPEKMDVTPVDRQRKVTQALNSASRKSAAPVEHPLKFALPLPRDNVRDRPIEKNHPPPPPKSRGLEDILTRPRGDPNPGKWNRVSPKKEPVLEISEVIAQIGDALTAAIYKRFDDTTTEMTLGQLALLQSHKNALEPMLEEGIKHFNALVDLEEEYRVRRRKIENGVESLKNATSLAAATAKKIMQENDRNGLANRMSRAGFTKPSACRRKYRS